MNEHEHTITCPANCGQDITLDVTAFPGGQVAVNLAVSVEAHRPVCGKWALAEEVVARWESLPELAHRADGVRQTLRETYVLCHVNALKERLIARTQRHMAFNPADHN